VEQVHVNLAPNAALPTGKRAIFLGFARERYDVHRPPSLYAASSRSAIR
jgi:hypothetical protein